MAAFFMLCFIAWGLIAIIAELDEISENMENAD
jgi:hypothetical protein